MELHIDGLEDLLRRVVREELDSRQDTWLSTREAAAYIGTSTGHVHNLVSQQKLPRHGERGHGLRFRREELDTYIEGRRST